MAALSLWLLAGCAGELDEPERFAFLLDGDGGASGTGGGGALVAPPECVTKMFADKCGSSVCHSAGAMQVDLTSPGVEKRLVDQSSSDELDCKGRTFVSTDGSASLLLDKLTGPDCGLKMPFGGTASTEEIDCVRGWVNSVSGSSSGEDGGP